jgi:hypothetical protein
MNAATGLTANVHRVGVCPGSNRARRRARPVAVRAAAVPGPRRRRRQTTPGIRPPQIPGDVKQLQAQGVETTTHTPGQVRAPSGGPSGFSAATTTPACRATCRASHTVSPTTSGTVTISALVGPSHVIPLPWRSPARSCSHALVLISFQRGESSLISITSPSACGTKRSLLSTKVKLPM